MLLRLSRFVHRLPMDEGRVLLIHAISHLRLVIDRDLDQALDNFVTPCMVDDAAADAISALLECGILTDKSPDGERDQMARDLSAFHGRDPDDQVQRLRREAREGGEPYWAANHALGLSDFSGLKTRLDVLLFGDCDIQMEADFLRRDAAGGASICGSPRPFPMTSASPQATVRALWTYPDHYPRGRLLTPDDFVTWRVNWTDKAENILSIADELGFAVDAFVFIDDTAIERDRARAGAPSPARGRGMGRGPARPSPLPADRSPAAVGAAQHPFMLETRLGVDMDRARIPAKHPSDIR